VVDLQLLSALTAKVIPKTSEPPTFFEPWCALRSPDLVQNRLHGTFNSSFASPCHTSLNRCCSNPACCWSARRVKKIIHDPDRRPVHDVIAGGLPPHAGAPASRPDQSRTSCCSASRFVWREKTADCPGAVEKREAVKRGVCSYRSRFRKIVSVVNVMLSSNTAVSRLAWQRVRCSSDRNMIPGCRLSHINNSVGQGDAVTQRRTLETI